MNLCEKPLQLCYCALPLKAKHMLIKHLTNVFNHLYEAINSLTLYQDQLRITKDKDLFINEKFFFQYHAS